mgnify:CR=1 FL=1
MPPSEWKCSKSASNLKFNKNLIHNPENNNELIVSNKEIKDLIQQRIELCQANLTSYEKVVKFLDSLYVPLER